MRSSVQKRPAITAIVVVFCSLTAAASAHAQVLTENFDDITTLTGKGFQFINRSNPGSLDGGSWYQGNPDTFAAQSGASTSYVEADYSATGGSDPSGDTISDWMLTPTVPLQNGEVIQFYTRTNEGYFPDRLELRLSANGTSTDVGGTESSVGDFTTLLLSVNPDLISGDGGYPTTWTLESVALTGLPEGVTQGRIGFRYYVTDAGSGGSNSDYIGIDSLSVSAASSSSPEPAGLALMLGGAGLPMAAAFAAKARRQRRQAVRTPA